MTRGLLIAGNESTLSAAIAAEAGKRFEFFCAALIPNRLPYPAESRPPVAAGDPGRGPVLLDWNPGSPVSARGLVLAAENRMGRIDEAILACTPPWALKKAEDLKSADIETMANDHIKGWFFLAKELAALFKARGSGSLALALSASGGDRDGVDLIGPSVSASFSAFAQGLMASAQDERYDVFGFTFPAGSFSGGSGQGDGAAAFIFKIMEDGRRNRGKWHKFGSKLSFLGR
jgi:NAD(P)-dependent dehydrogenase (short-subunit alcohol dehydrogenase family)